MVDIWHLVSYGLWVGFAAGLGSFIYGVVLGVLGREGYGRFIAGKLASILIVAFEWGLVQALYGSSTPPVPHGWIFYAISGILLVSSATYLALGRMAERSWGLIGALLIMGIGFFAASLASGVEIGPSGTISVIVVPSTTMLKNNEELKLAVIPAGGEPSYNIVADWEDGENGKSV